MASFVVFSELHIYLTGPTVASGLTHSNLRSQNFRPHAEKMKSFGIILLVIVVLCFFLTEPQFMILTLLKISSKIWSS